MSRTGAEVDPGLSRAEQKRRGVTWGQEVGRRRDSDGETGIPVTSTKSEAVVNGCKSCPGNLLSPFLKPFLNLY